MDIDTIIKLITMVLSSYEASADKVARIREIINNADKERKTKEEK